MKKNKTGLDLPLRLSISMFIASSLVLCYMFTLIFIGTLTEAAIDDIRIASIIPARSIGNSPVTVPSITNVQLSPDPLYQHEPLTIRAKITDDDGLGQVTVSTQDGPTYFMQPVGNDIYEAVINFSENSGSVNYVILAINQNGDGKSLFGNYLVEEIGILGNSLPGDWRPFAEDSPWNTPIPPNAVVHPQSQEFIDLESAGASKIRFANSYTIPVWVVDSTRMPFYYVKSPNIVDTWDQDQDGISDVPVPVSPVMWPENTSDGHITIIDPVLNIAWEMSRFKWLEDGPHSTTFNIWNLNESGVADPFSVVHYQRLGGRGSGFPIIAGLIRPEEIENGVIDHALVFVSKPNRVGENGDNIFMHPPAARSDGEDEGVQFPIEGMLFQLDPTLDDSYFDSIGLSQEARIVARALQKYGMYLGDIGGPMALQPQLLSPNSGEHRDAWDALFPNLYSTIDNIPTDKFRVIYTGEPTILPD